MRLWVVYMWLPIGEPRYVRGFVGRRFTALGRDSGTHFGCGSSSEYWQSQLEITVNFDIELSRHVSSSSRRRRILKINIDDASPFKQGRHNPGINASRVRHGYYVPCSLLKRLIRFVQNNQYKMRFAIQHRITVEVCTVNFSLSDFAPWTIRGVLRRGNLRLWQNTSQPRIWFFTPDWTFTLTWGHKF